MNSADRCRQLFTIDNQPCGFRMCYGDLNYIFMTLYEIFCYLDESPFIPIPVALDIMDWCSQRRCKDDFHIWASPYEHYWIDIEVVTYD